MLLLLHYKFDARAFQHFRSLIMNNWPADYHMHTPLCQHAAGEPMEYARQALQIGLREIGFSDHSPMPRDDFDEWRMRADQLAEYIAKVERARAEFPDLVIKLGLEVDYLPGQEDWIRDLVQRYPWDYFIGSVHYIAGDWVIDNPATVFEWKNRDPMEVWSAYFDRLTMAAESGLFDIIGHADLCKKFGFYPQQDYTSLYIPFLKAASERGIAIELNTAGLRKPCKEIYPSARLLQQANALGIPITFGSDAHAPEEVGMNFAEAVALAQGAGYTQACRFARRIRSDIPLRYSP